jgi:hypothetical protein
MRVPIRAPTVGRLPSRFPLRLPSRIQRPEPTTSSEAAARIGELLDEREELLSRPQTSDVLDRLATIQNEVEDYERLLD